MSELQTISIADISNLRASWVKKIHVARVEGVAIDGECWVWTGARDKASGYGRVQFEKQCRYTHRLFYELLAGPIPPGMQIDHLCRNRACCAPHHMEPVTPLVNTHRGSGNASRTRCPEGHQYAGENLRLWTDKRGYTRRVCRQCNRETVAQWQADRKARQAATWDLYLPDRASKTAIGPVSA